MYSLFGQSFVRVDTQVSAKKTFSLYSLQFIWVQMVQTPLHVAAGYNNVEILKFLLGWSGPEKVEMEAKNMVCAAAY